MMPYGDLDSDDYRGTAMALLPRGIAWPRNPESVMFAFWSGVGDFLWALHVLIVQIFEIELDPSQTQILLPDWENAYGIVPRGSKDDRRARLVSVITDPGGFTGAHYVALAATIGITVTVEKTGLFAWTVHAPNNLLADDKAALEAVITLHNRITCAVAFAYDNFPGGRLDFSDPENSGLSTL